MLFNRFSVAIPLFLFLNLIFLSVNYSVPLSKNPDDIAVNCGSSGNSIEKHGRQWIGDVGSKYISTSQGSKAKLIRSTATDQSLSPNPIPYMTARISRQQFTYAFRVSEGQKFIRLHFYPTAYSGFERSNAFFTVKAGPYTLLSNFSASLTADALGVKYIVKEFCVDLEENPPLIITFSPSTSGTSHEAYAFVNGIEIIAMPPGLYYTLGGEPGPRIVGNDYRFSIDKRIALEMVYRLNVGGSFISSTEDTGLFREWSDDSNFLVTPDVQPVSTSVRIKFRGIPTYTAPQKVYQTSWSTVLDKQAKTAYNFSWKLPIDLGFRYLIRFHFCVLEYEIEESSHLRFSILINDQVAEANADLIKWSGGNGVAVFRDYMVLMEGDRMEGKRDLLISLCPKWSDSDERGTESTDAILKGLELFKLSNPDNNLAGVNPMYVTRTLNSRKPNPRKFVFAHGGNAIATVIVILISLLNVIVYQLRILGEQNSNNTISSSPSEGLSRRFSLAEVRSATSNFDSALIIGSGGFGKVYKGLIDGGPTTVAIKRLNSKSKQGPDEFWTEIEMLSKLRHTHLVSLIGYSDEGHEMILVYEYMEHGTLADHLYKISRNEGTNSDLSWEQKLNICIGAARGLDYLHTGTQHGVIHRDVKTTNILLDKEWVAKISDFGLCKIGTTSHSRTHISTNVKGTFGYLDPEYFLTRRLTKKSDVYAFGVVLLEVLCGRPAVDISLREECRSLALWAQQCIKEGKLDEIIDPNLGDQTSSHCLKVFAEVAYKCLHNRPKGRPTMADVVVSLEGALTSQNQYGELSNERDKEEREGEVNDDVSDNEHMDDTLKLNDDLLQGDIPSPSTPVQFTENISQIRKRSNGKLSKAFQWSIGILAKSMDIRWRKKKDNDSSSRQSWVASDSSERLQWDNSSLPCRRFSFQEIRAATNNFSSNLKIGEGGFGSMYRGWIDHGTLEVAISCVKPLAEELYKFKAEIEAQSHLRHLHIISLLGYCADKGKMMLVYNYMVNRSLHDHIYGEGSGHSPLPWRKRLEICIGAAQGLYYLHSGTAKRIIHRNIKPSKILLDENWNAKISDFELSKEVPTDCTAVTTRVCGTWGYLDPEYIHHLRLTEKSDVYAFGVVLLEVLCARKPYDVSVDEDQKPLVRWFQTCLRMKIISPIIDPYLVGRISPECLMKYLEIAWACLLDHGAARPTMNYVAESLRVALQLQQTWYIDAEIDATSEGWIQFVTGRAYDNVLAYASPFADIDSGSSDLLEYSDLFENIDRGSSDILAYPSAFANIDTGGSDLSFTTDHDIGLTMPLR